MKTYKVDDNLEDQAELARFNLIRDSVANTLLRIELLYSRTGDVSVLGMLRRHKGNTYAIEDPTGYIRLTFKDVVFEDGSMNPMAFIVITCYSSRRLAYQS